MKKRQLRQNTMRDILREHAVRTQGEMVERLREAGFECTQATVSRDIEDMGLVKSSVGYVLPEELRLQRIVSDMVEDVQAAGNVLVIHTAPGGAPGVSAVIDSAELKGALGTVAGDNTIMMVAETPEAAVHIKMSLDRLRRP